MKYVMLMLSLLYTNEVFADIYKMTDKYGNIIYTDTPDKDAEKIEVSSLPLHTTPSKSVTIEKNKTIVANAVPITPYQVFAISSPLNEETLHNVPNIIINVAIEPALKASDKIQIFVDEA